MTLYKLKMKEIQGKLRSYLDKETNPEMIGRVSYAIITLNEEEN